jgi:hypothetical protein
MFTAAAWKEVSAANGAKFCMKAGPPMAAFHAARLL